MPSERARVGAEGRTGSHRHAHTRGQQEDPIRRHQVVAILPREDRVVAQRNHPAAGTRHHSLPEANQGLQRPQIAEHERTQQ